MHDDVRQRIFRTALTARRFEECVVRLAKAGEVPATLHVGAGHEVFQAAALAALRDDDPMLYAHRGTAYWIARGLPLERILCDLTAREGGTNRGKGGVMHVVDPARGILGESGTLGGNFVLGAGIAYAEQRLGTGTVTIVFFGDGTANRGQFHEAANFAGLARLPLVLCCENNGIALSVPVGASTSVRDIAERAAGYGMPGTVVDGSDAEAVFETMAAAADRARRGDGPSLIEAKLARMAGHWLGDREPYRTEVDRAALLAGDPLPRLEADLRRRGLLDDERLGALEQDIARAIDEAVTVMRSRPPVEVSTALECAEVSRLP